MPAEEALSIFKSMAVPTVAFSGGLIASKVAPNLLGLTGWKRTGAQAALGFGIIYAGQQSRSDTVADMATFVGIGLFASALVELVEQFIPAGIFAGLGAYPHVSEASIYEVSANALNNELPELPADFMEKPALADGFSAYPDETSSFRGSFESYKY